MSFTWQRAIILRKVWVEAEGTINHQKRECRYPAVLPSLTDIASNNTAYSNSLVIDCKSAYFVDSLLRLGGAVCRQRQMWPIFGSSILTVCEVTERSVSNTVWWKVEQQSIAVLHSKQCHFSTISVQIVYLQPLRLCTASNRPLQYNLYKQYNTQLLNLFLCCNCSTICAMSPFTTLYSNTCWVFPTFHHI